jgi:hypothetical protein
MRIQRKGLFWGAVAVCAFLLLSAFIPVSHESGFNYIVVDTLLGVMIFHNVYVLSAIILALAFALASSISFGN